MHNTIRMTEAQFLKVKRLIRKLCCNYYDGDCVLLDRNYEPAPCPQITAKSLLCRYFRDAVLPNDLNLYAQLTNIKPEKFCSVCREPIYSKASRVKYCPACAKAVRRKQEAERQQKRYISLRK